MSASSTSSPVELVIAGRSYRLVSSSSPAELKRLAQIVEERLQQLGAGAQTHPQALLLVALALAHDLSEAETRNADLRTRSRRAVEGLLARVDDALGHVDENGVPLAAVAGGSPMLG